MRVLLDTQVLVQAYLAEEKLPKRVLAVLADPETDRLISAVSLMEIAVKATRLNMSELNVRQAVRDLQLTIVPFTGEHSYRLFSLPEKHRDPFDRMIIVTALTENVPLIGGDHIFKKYRELKTLWN